MSQQLLLTFTALCCAAACGSGQDSQSMQPGESPDGGNIALSAGPGEIALRVSEAVATERGAYPGRVQISVSFEIANGQGSEPAPLAFAYFSVRTEDGLEVVASGGSGECPAEASLLGGSTKQCKVVVQLSPGSIPKTLRYNLPKVDGGGISARVAETPIVNYRPCTVCGDICIDLQNDTENCGKCGADLTGSSATCVNGTPSCPGALLFCASNFYPASSSARCIDSLTSQDACGACGLYVSDGSCEAGKPKCGNGQIACPSPYSATGSVFCSALDSWSEACGSCDKTCAHITWPSVVGSACNKGVCSGWVSTGYAPSAKSCDDFCAQAGFDRCVATLTSNYACSTTKTGYVDVSCRCEGAPR